MTQKQPVLVQPKLFASLLSISVCFLLTQCGSDSSSDSKTSSDFDSLHGSFFKQCSGCHGDTSNDGTVGGPDLTSKDKVRSQLVSKTVSKDYSEWATFLINREACQDIQLINPGNSSKSLVYAVIDDDTAAALSPCAVKSHLDPPQSINISSSTKAQLKQWIEDGAKP